MSRINKTKTAKRNRRHKRIRSKIYGTPENPRLSVFRSNQYIYAQIIDDTKGVTLVSADTKGEKDEKVLPLTKASSLGKKLGQDALKKGIKKVVFDKGGYLYTGKIKALADGARESGLQF